MKSKKVIHEISDTVPINRNIYFFKFFSLSIWLMIIGVSLGFVAKSARAGTDAIDLYYRYVPYEGPKSATGTGANQPPKQSSGANTEAKKPDTAEQAPSTAGKGEAAGTKSEEAKKTDSGQQPQKSSESPATAGTGQAEEAKKINPEEQAKKPEENAGQQAKEQSAPAGNSSQAPAPDREMTTTRQNPSHEPLKKQGSMSPDPNVKDTGQVPAFSQVDINRDHYVTKDELQNFPELLKIFDKVDAGKDGRLEQHEFQNLEMETKREGEITL